MPLPPITRFSSLATDPSQTNNNNGLYTPQLTDVQITAIPTKTKRNGGIWYNNTLNQLEAQVNGNTIPLGAGNGNVSGPANSTNNNIAVFDGTTGKVIKDSGVGINQVPGPPPLLRSSIDTLTPNAFVNEISNIGHIKFINDVSSIYVDTLTSIRFFPYDDQICSVFTSEIGAGGSSTSQSALLEINSDSGVLLLSRLTDQEQTALAAPLVAGMMFYNKTSNVFKCRDNSGWRIMPLYNTNGTLDVATPISSTNAATKGYVDSSVGAVSLTLTGNVTGSGLVASPIVTTLNMTLDQINAPVSNLNLNNHNIINLLDPTTAQQAATKAYVDTSTSAIGAAKFIIQTTNGLLPNAQALGSLTTGLLMNTTTTGVLSIGVPGTDYYSLGNPTRILNSSSNLFIGTNAGNTSLSTASNNVGLGDNALKSLIVGEYNVAVGTEALKNNTDGSHNVAVGYGALQLNTTGQYNVAVGEEALQNNTTGISNIAVGTLALQLNTTGKNNVAVGTGVLANNTTGENSVAVGYGALQLNTTGKNNVAIGYETLLSNTTGENNVAIGSGALQNNISGFRNLVIGISALQNNTASDNLAVGFQALLNNDTGDSNVAVGFRALYNNISGTSNLAIGISALQNNTASDNLAVGFQALLNNDTGNNNLAIGTNTLLLNISGTSNLAIGNNALQNNTASNNLAIGYQAGSVQSSYTNCTFLGYGADASANSRTNAVAIGYQASVGANNCMVLGGSGANQLSVGIGLTPNAQLQLPTIHANRKLVLYQTANNDHQVHGLGTAAGIFRFQLDSNSSSSAYTFNAGLTTTTSTELMRLTGDGYLGIGGVSPHAPLQFANTSLNRKIVLYDDNNNDHQFYGFGVGSSIFRFQVDSVGAAHVFYAGISTVTSNELMRIQGNGRVGIGTSSPDQMLSVNSSTPNKISGGTWSAFSDARIKDIVGDYEHGLAEIIQIKTRKFKYNDRSGYPDHEKAKINIGIIAQEIEEIFPECIVEKMERGDIPDMRLYDGTALTYALINAVKELNNEIINLKQQINN